MLSTRVVGTRPTEKDKEIDRNLAVLDGEVSTKSTSQTNKCEPPSMSRHATTQVDGAPKSRAKEELKPQQSTRGRLLSTSSDPTMDRTISALGCTTAPLKTSDTSVQTQKSSEKGQKHASFSLQAVLRKEGLRLETSQVVRRAKTL